MAENKKFRAARERTASLTYPDVCLSRQELAELASAWIWKHHNKKIVALSGNYVGKLEQGKILWPGKLYREALRAILGASTDAALGFVNTQRAVVKLADVDRRQAIQTTLSLGALATLGPVSALLEGSEPTPIPHRIGATEIEQVRTAKQVFQSWGLIYGGGLAREAVMGQLSWSARLREAICPDELQPALYSAIGDLADTAAYMA
ncbi:MAG: XRE family transcriptional regulator, partial [Pseudonocardiaceae bacterium]